MISDEEFDELPLDDRMGLDDDENEATVTARRIVSRQMVAMMAERGITIPDLDTARANTRRELESLVGPERADEMMALLRRLAPVFARRVLIRLAEDHPDE